MARPTEYRVTRDVGHDERGNYSGESFAEGDVLYQPMRPTYGCTDTSVGIALTKDPTGDYPFFEFPLNAVEVARA
jgi:hypothetical protein